MVYRTTQNRRGAFTLVELLVVISIIGMLAALTLPAVMRAVQTARMAQTVNNHTEISKGILSYEQQKEHFPPGLSLQTSATNGTHVWPWTVRILPFIDKQEVYDSLRDNPNLSVAANTPFIAVYVSPVDEKSSSQPSTSIAGNFGRLDSDVGNPNADDLDATGIFQDWRGTKRKLKVDIADIRDSKSSTILFAENVNVQKWTDTAEEYSQGLLWYPVTDAPVKINDEIEDPLPANRARPASRLPSGFVAGFADGSAKFISQDIVYLVYCQMMTPNGKEAANRLGGADPDVIKAQRTPISDAGLNP